MQFRDRNHGGELLADALKPLAVTRGTVLGLPRGGVVTASVVARALHLPLDVLVVKKIGAPDNAELAIGAVAEGPIIWKNPAFTGMPGVTPAYIDREVRQLEQRIEEKTRRFRSGKGAVSVRGETVILVDDGIATGATMMAAVLWCRTHGAARIIVAVPTSSRDGLALLEHEGVETVVLDTPEWFSAVGQFYDNFSQTEDEEVVQLLAAAGSKGGST